MQIKISARHGHLSETTQGKIRERLEPLTRIFERISSIDCVADLEHKDALKVDLQVSAEHKHDFIAHDSADELIKAVDGAVHKMEQQLRKYKEKLQERGQGLGVKSQANNDTDELDDDEE